MDSRPQARARGRLRVLAGDVGGTHTRLALVEVDRADWRIVREREFKSREYEGLEKIVHEFLSDLDVRPDRAGFGVACPVIGGACRLTNLKWELEAGRFADEIGISHTNLINDFEAVGHALELLGPDDCLELQPGRVRPRAPIALIGAGTGLGEAYLLWHGGRYRVHVSEGGHADFAPRNSVEDQLLHFLRERYGRVSYERVVSGPGLVDIYRFLVERRFGEERPETRRAMEESDAAAAISQRALSRADETCVRALDLFVSAYGSQAGNLALTVQARGGVYVAGGIAPKIIQKLKDGSFVEAFRRKGRLSDLMEEIPVRVITHPKVGLLGAAAAAVSAG